SGDLAWMRARPGTIRPERSPAGRTGAARRPAQRKRPRSPVGGRGRVHFTALRRLVAVAVTAPVAAAVAMPVATAVAVVAVVLATVPVRIAVTPVVLLRDARGHRRRTMT